MCARRPESRELLATALAWPVGHLCNTVHKCTVTCTKIEKRTMENNPYDGCSAWWSTWHFESDQAPMHVKLRLLLHKTNETLISLKHARPMKLCSFWEVWKGTNQFLLIRKNTVPWHGLTNQTRFWFWPVNYLSETSCSKEKLSKWN